MTRIGPLRPIVDDDIRVDIGSLRRELLEAVERGDNVLLLGPAGSGKTTALTQLAADLQAVGQPVVLVRGQLARTLDDLIALIWDALPAPVPKSGTSLMPQIDQEQFFKGMARGPQAAIVSTAKQIEMLRRPEPATILLDDLTDASIAEDLFGRARDLLWDLGHQWVVAARPAQAAALQRAPAGAFWGARIRIPEPSPDEWAEILTKRGLPRTSAPVATAALREGLVAASASPQERPESPQPASAALSMPTRTLLDQLAALDRPVTADDEELLDRLGWSRPYTSAVLRRLENAGLVDVAPEQRATPGRPRNLYSVSQNAGRS